VTAEIYLISRRYTLIVYDHLNVMYSEFADSSMELELLAMAMFGLTVSHPRVNFLDSRQKSEIQ
jgi:hypothetical protein